LVLEVECSTIMCFFSLSSYLVLVVLCCFFPLFFLSWVPSLLVAQGFISYPRTETTKYSRDFDFKSILSSLKGHGEFGEATNSILKNGIKPLK